MIISLRGEPYSMIGALNLIGELCHGHTNCRVLVMLDIRCGLGLRYYLARCGNQVTVIKPGSPLPNSLGCYSTADEKEGKLE